MKELLIVCDSTGSTTGLNVENLTSLVNWNKNNSQSICFSKDNVLFSGQCDKNAVNMYHLRKSSPIFQCTLSERITSLQCSPDGIYLIGGGESGSIYVWQVASGNLLKIVNSGHVGAIRSLCVSSGDGSMVVSGGEDSVIRIWTMADLLDIQNGGDTLIKAVCSISSHSLAITWLQFTGTVGNHMKLISSSLDRTVKIFHVGSCTEICSIGYPCAIACVVLDRTEQVLFAAGVNGDIYETHLYPYVPMQQQQQQQQQIIVTSNSKATTGGALNFGGTKIVNVEKGNVLHQSHSDYVTGLFLTLDESKLISTSLDGTIVIRDVVSKQVLRTMTISSSDNASNSKITTSLLVHQFHDNDDDDDDDIIISSKSDEIVKGIRKDQKRKGRDTVLRQEQLHALKKFVGHSDGTNDGGDTLIYYY